MRNENKTEAELQRHKAEKLLKEKSSKSGTQLSEIETLKLIHELEVHQIELELQNERLMRAKSAAQDSAGKFAELYDFAPSGYFTLSDRCEIIELNLSGANMLGKERAHIINRHLVYFISSDTKPIFNRFFDRVFSSKTTETCEVVLSRDGNLPMDVYLTGIVAENGEQCHLTAINITHRKQVEETLQNERLLLRTPLNGILGFADLLKESDLSSDEQKKYINIIEKGGARLLNIINNILNISKIESGQMEVLISETNINEQMEHVYTFFKEEAEQKGLQILIRNALPAKEATIEMDREKVYSILTNLVKNPIKFSPAGSIETPPEWIGTYEKF